MLVDERTDLREVERPYTSDPILLQQRGSFYVADATFLLRYATQGKGAEVGVNAQRKVPVVLEKHIGRERIIRDDLPSLDPESIWSYSFRLTKGEGLSRVFIGRNYAVSLLDKDSSGLLVQVASSEPLWVQEYKNQNPVPLLARILRRR